MMHDLLLSKGTQLSVQTVRKYMNVELGLRSVTRKKKLNYSSVLAPHNLFDNLLQQDFHAIARNKKWCIDFTYLFFAGGKKRYNCSIIDLYDRRIVASVNGSRITAQLGIEAVVKALKRTRGTDGLILHSDQGSQFTAKEFIEFCKRNGITQSMSKRGCPYDNAPIERYFNTLKAELLYLNSFDTEDALYVAINAYAYGWYNNMRPHSYNGGMPPAKVS